MLLGRWSPFLPSTSSISSMWCVIGDRNKWLKLQSRTNALFTCRPVLSKSCWFGETTYLANLLFASIIPTVTMVFITMVLWRLKSKVS